MTERQGGANAARGEARAATLLQDFNASVVVFLVALPLCMGIAIASGAPPEKGLITGIIGGIVVGVLSGSPLQVSGPAAGLAVIVFEAVREFGLAALGPILLLAGLLQALAGVLRVGVWFRAVSPAVVHGMLAGIGALIVLGQLHVLVDRSPQASGIENLRAIPEAFFDLSPLTLGAAEAALAVGLTTIAGMLAWEQLRPTALKLVPGALIGVLAGTILAFTLGLSVQRIDVPASLFDAIATPSVADLARLAEPAILTTAFVIAFIASAETLLSAAAVDRMHDGPRTAYNKELFAQGVGNALCGLAGALPMTGVIVRSSANVQAGARTRASAIMHGVWILAFVAALPFVLEMVPTAALAAVLVVTGWRLVKLSLVRHMFEQYGLLPALVWVGTFVTVLATDLLTGVIVGVALSLLELAPHVRRLKLDINHAEGGEGEAVRLALSGRATAVQLPKLTQTLDAVPEDQAVRLDLDDLAFIDHTTAELLSDWIKRRRQRGTAVELTASAQTERVLGLQAA